MGDHIFELGPRDGRFIRAGGVYVFIRRDRSGAAQALYVGEAEVIAAQAGPGHPAWTEAVMRGLSGLLVVLESDPVRRRRFASELIATLAPPLNDLAPSWPGAAGLASADTACAAPPLAKSARVM